MFFAAKGHKQETSSSEHSHEGVGEEPSDQRRQAVERLQRRKRKGAFSKTNWRHLGVTSFTAVKVMKAHSENTLTQMEQVEVQ